MLQVCFGHMLLQMYRHVLCSVIHINQLAGFVTRYWNSVSVHDKGHLHLYALQCFLYANAVALHAAQMQIPSDGTCTSGFTEIKTNAILWCASATRDMASEQHAFVNAKVRFPTEQH